VQVPAAIQSYDTLILPGRSNLGIQTSYTQSTIDTCGGKRDILRKGSGQGIENLQVVREFYNILDINDIDQCRVMWLKK
jgi:hypothetical protein